MKFMYLNIHPTRLFGPTRLIGTWEYVICFSSFELSVAQFDNRQFHEFFLQGNKIFNDKVCNVYMYPQVAFQLLESVRCRQNLV